MSLVRRSPKQILVYILQKYVGWLMTIGLSLIFFVFLIEYMTGLDRYNHASVNSNVVFFVALARLPNLALELFPVVFFLASLITLTQATRSSELIVARSIGLSFRMFLRPLVITAFLSGLVASTIFNPIATRIESYVFNLYGARFGIAFGEVNERLASQAQWFTQNHEQGFAVVNLGRFSKRAKAHTDVTISEFDDDGQFLKRYQAEWLKQNDGSDVLENVWILQPDAKTEFQDQLVLPYNLSIENQLPVFAQANQYSIFDLPQIIRISDEFGARSESYRAQFHKLLSLPLYFVALTLLAACFSLRLPRKGGMGLTLALGAIVALITHFASSMLLAIGSVGLIAAPAAIWTPIVMLLFAVLAYLLHTEDG